MKQTWVLGDWDTPKSENSIRTIAFAACRGELALHLERTAYQGDDERVFCHPDTGQPLPHERDRETLRAAFKQAVVEWPERWRPMQDLRVTCLTNEWLASANRGALTAKAGHANFSTTQGYIDVAKEAFPRRRSRSRRG